ncbi:unnamed protein product [Cuscuta europaea]|uniref:Uncharacterized protein n=1 Tax=Cuscuta europaea TaxID=41803 RepID=A0A9P0Z8C9_CUSEU|nr:unnamed protein product [Cuscuta europaea]
MGATTCVHTMKERNEKRVSEREIREEERASFSDIKKYTYYQVGIARPFSRRRRGNAGLFDDKAKSSLPDRVAAAKRCCRDAVSIGRIGGRPPGLVKLSVGYPFFVGGSNSGSNITVII